MGNAPFDTLGYLLYTLGFVWYPTDELRLVKEAAEHKDIDIKTLKEQISTNAQKCSSDKLSAVGEVTRSE